MQCQICHEREATIHLTEISDGVRSETHVCEQCAVEQGIAVKSQLSLNELLSGILAAQPSDDEMAGGQIKELVCPSCGFSLEDFRKESVLGCPNDYEVFEQVLLPLMAKAHDGKTQHCGKIPLRAPCGVAVDVELLNLRKQLDAAVRKENYEEAAKLRDRITEIEKQ